MLPSKLVPSLPRQQTCHNLRLTSNKRIVQEHQNIYCILRKNCEYHSLMGGESSGLFATDKWLFETRFVSPL